MLFSRYNGFKMKLKGLTLEEITTFIEDHEKDICDCIHDTSDMMNTWSSNIYNIDGNLYQLDFINGYVIKERPNKGCDDPTYNIYEVERIEIISYEYAVKKTS